MIPVLSPNDPYFNNVSLLLSSRDGLIKDYSKNNLSITNTNVAISSTQSKLGNKSFYFNGSSLLDVSNPSSILYLNGNFDISLWVCSSNFVSGYTTCILTANGAGAWNASDAGLRLHQDNLIFGGASFTQINYPALTVGQWAFIQIKRENNVIYLYKNGSLAGSASYNGVIGVSNWGVGFSDRAYGSPREFFNGYIPELRITKGIARPIQIPTQPFPNW